MKILLPFSNRHRILYAASLLLTIACSSTPTQQESGSAGTPALPSSYDRALVLMQSGDYQKAIPVLRKFVAKEPELAGPWVNIGIAYRKTGQSDAALEALGKALELNPKNAVAHHQMGILYRERGQFDAAQQAYAQALKLDPDYALVHRNLGILYDLYLQQPALALEHYRKYLELAREPDKRVSDWVIDLERRTGNSQAKAAT